MADRRPGEGRYAQVEREQRWIAAGLPVDARRTAEILDRYICGTRLRLRRMEMSGEVVFKLGQKVRLDPTDPEVVMLTTMYVSGDEYDVIAALPAGELRKTRWHTAWDGRTVAVDEFTNGSTVSSSPRLSSVPATAACRRCPSPFGT